MRFTTTAIVAAVSLVALAACAGQGSAPAVSSSSQTYPVGSVNGKPIDPAARPAAVRGYISPAAKSKKLVYVADTYYGLIDIFSQNGQNQTPLGMISSGLSHPGGLAVDKKGNLYVANEVELSTGWTVPVYAAGATKPSKVFTTDLNTPTDVAVASDGTIYIANFNGLSNGWVSVYPKGNVKKEYRLSDFSGGAPLSVALDKGGNVYVMYDTDSNGDAAVNKYAPKATTGTNLNLQFKYGAGIAVDKTGNVLVVQQLNPPAVLVFPPGQSVASQTIQLPNEDQLFDIALTANDKQLFVGDPTSTEVVAIKYPGAQLKGVLAGGFGNPGGIALAR
jgi:sugar lactone lactonase YvrE